MNFVVILLATACVCLLSTPVDALYRQQQQGRGHTETGEVEDSTDHGTFIPCIPGLEGNCQPLGEHHIHRIA
uniref:Uncharacterized protein n=1 Tax=Anopheles dirus TaxID=7168 RepID=A0A182NXE5_9DIPT